MCLHTGYLLSKKAEKVLKKPNHVWATPDFCSWQIYADTDQDEKVWVCKSHNQGPTWFSNGPISYQSPDIWLFDIHVNVVLEKMLRHYHEWPNLMQNKQPLRWLSTIFIFKPHPMFSVNW